MVKHPLSFFAGIVAGVLAMYYLDERSGRRRRALVRDRLVATGHDLGHMAGYAGKHVRDRMRGVMATHRLDRVSHSAPHSDQQLHDRLRSRLGRFVAHPKAVAVVVDPGGCVRLFGHVMRHEEEALCREIRGMAGVTEVRNELQVHDTPTALAEAYARSVQPDPAPAGRVEQQPVEV